MVSIVIQAIRWAIGESDAAIFVEAQSGRIAVKVINHHGDEAMRVFPVR